MLTPGSRYEHQEVRHLTIADPDGTTREVAYLARRVLPPLTGQVPLARHQVAPGERLDVLAARFLADPTRFWMICDANPVLRPAELDVPGRSFVVVAPRR